MGVECNRRRGAVSGYRPHDNSVLILDRVHDSHRLHLFNQDATKFQLAWTAGVGSTLFDRRGVDLNILQKAIEKSLSIHGLMVSRGHSGNGRGENRMITSDIEPLFLGRGELPSG